MTLEDEEFNRIERESIARKLSVQYALEKERQRAASPIPLITDEEWQALNNDE